ncbi:Protein EXPORTIN 1A [Camellia lanceoleosa]|uniref:Protein EXPORTIN 1A n=1 Tax=Camellia lanceoleosa TaxID=1840588 RepID=A0ACC0FXB0_9ERIC|nr:Protein EXPORTIN 1A [Camellia lanceoleosa]
MAYDTFLKIVQKCKRKFVIMQIEESEPFVSELLTSLPITIADLEPHQIHSFYESVFLVEFFMNYNIVGAFSTCRILISELIGVEGDGMADVVCRCIQEMDINNQIMVSVVNPHEEYQKRGVAIPVSIMGSSDVPVAHTCAEAAALV